jgi:hypothetical protein
MKTKTARRFLIRNAWKIAQSKRNFDFCKMTGKIAKQEREALKILRLDVRNTRNPASIGV